MANRDRLTAVLLDEAALDLDDMARACGVEPEWVRRHVQAGLLPVQNLAGDAQSGQDIGGGQASVGQASPGQDGGAPVLAELDIVHWRFRSGELNRARRLASIERDFDADEELAALVVDLADEVRRLRARLAALGFR